MTKRIKDESGVTLVELLAAMAIMGIIAAVAYQALVLGYKYNEKIRLDQQLRDEADLIMVSLTRELFTLKTNEVKVIGACEDGGNDSYVLVSPAGKPSYKLGFINGHVQTKDGEIKPGNGVTFTPNTCTGPNPLVHNEISSVKSDASLSINFTLEAEGRSESFNNTVNLIEADSFGD